MQEARAQRGRPPIYGEKMVQKPVHLPASLLRKVKAKVVAKTPASNANKFIREAIEEKLAREEKQVNA